VRFSWLTRQSDHKELAKFIGSYYAKANKVFRNLSGKQQDELSRIGGPVDDWTKSWLTNEKCCYLERQEKLSLDAMAVMYDSLFNLIQCHEALIAFYDADRKEQFSALHLRWRDACRKIST
jgi:hypothetical protein